MKKEQNLMAFLFHQLKKKQNRGMFLHYFVKKEPHSLTFLFYKVYKEQNLMAFLFYKMQKEQNLITFLCKRETKEQNLVLEIGWIRWGVINSNALPRVIVWKGAYFCSSSFKTFCYFLVSPPKSPNWGTFKLRS